ncbi:unnamed protein product [Parnassius apollo]|uniref:(apollo) hypothetical protein n=1 Tax=Parnassius apollo TaxID=110799 RepID=A0A8S3X7G1_PARAO|nr:unnamed protein product [Parnassius apollo]
MIHKPPYYHIIIKSDFGDVRFNKIFDIAPGVFTHLHRLRSLLLNDNQLRELRSGAFHGLRRLKYLYLYRNRIQHIDSDVFQGMIHLEQLYLHVNEIHQIEPETFSHLPRLERLYLHNNHLKRIPPGSFRGLANLRKLRLDSNALICDCSMLWFVRMLSEHRAMEIAATCYEPASATGASLATMKEHDFHCRYPVFTILPRDQITRLNEIVRFDCVAKGNPAPHILWYFNRARILLTDRITMHHNGSIVIEKIQQTDAGQYTCHAENLNGKITAEAVLEVMVAPAFITVPQDQVVTIGETAEFRCTARGAPKPVITWYRNTMVLPPSENIIFSDNNENLTILQVTTDDDGLYHCRAENSQGLTEISAILKVDEAQIIPPKIILKPEDTDAFKETSVQMPCEVDAEPPATIEWRKDGSRIEPNDRISISIIGSLIINNITITDSGRYECSAFNEYGRDTVSVFLTVKDHILPGDEYVNIALTEATRDVDQAISRTMEQLFKNDNSKANLLDLYRISRFPNAPAREVARAAEIYERTLEKVRGFIQSGLKITSADPFNYEQVVSAQHLEVIARLSGCVAHREEKDCSDMCFHIKYRSVDGSCNNFDHPTWGTSLSAFRRILFPIYENGFSHPVGWNKNITYNGYTLPSARLVSTAIISTKEISQDIEITHMVMQWGQWLDHDLDHALPSVSSQTWDGVDCKKTCDYAAPCFPIDVPEGDPRISNRRCIDFIRTSSVCGSGMTSVLFGKLQPREQINQLTSFIDASQVYGFEKAVAEDLRDLTNDSGLLRVGATFPGRKPLLPTIGINGMDCRRNLEESNRNCFVAGDIRANEQIGLAAMHTIFMREHNRIATKLKAINPFWDGDRVYQEARKIVGAEIQFITYKHWLPLVLGPEGVQQLGEYKGYNSKINPSISNVFATAALRFGHTMINPVLHRYDENFEPIPQGHLLLRYAFFSPWRLVDEGGVDPLLRGMFTTPAKLKTPTQNLNSELTEQLFHTAHAVALDLAAINIQRGRDHGLPPYTKFRDFCNMTEVNTFDDLATEISDKNETSLARILCDNGDNIDTIGENVFLLPEIQDGLISCDDLPSMDLRYWADCDSCGEDEEGEKHRSRRDVSSVNDIYSSFADYEERVNHLESSHDELEKMVKALKIRIKYLEDLINGFPAN